MLNMSIRPQRTIIGVDGRLHKAWEFDYHRATFYIQESADGYTIVEESPPRGTWMLVQPQRRQLILAEFDRVRRRQRL
jgi:hypothetical protein